MNNYIKQLVEAFDFNSVTKQKKCINAHDILLENKIKDVVYKILNKSKLGKRDASFILSLPPASYKTNDNEIHKLVKNCLKFFQDNCNLNWIDTSEVTDMHELFHYYNYDNMGMYMHNFDISKWNVSNVIDMSKMFWTNTFFNGDISKWDVSNVTNMSQMFDSSNFNGDISSWDVSNVTDMESMFYGSKFNGDISQWNVSNVTNMECMFLCSKFNGDISNWNVNNVTSMRQMFDSSNFNRDISNWNINPNCDILYMFNKWTEFGNNKCAIKEIYKPKIIDNIINSKINFSKINNISETNILLSIIKKIFNGNKISKNEYKILKSYISIYKVKNKDEIRDILYYFENIYMNIDNLNWIDTSEVTDMSDLFVDIHFNGDISKWNVSNVTNMGGMFRGNLYGISASSDSARQIFNGDISNWDVSNVTDMGYMFTYSQFNRDISKWNISNVKNMEAMFAHCYYFNKDISKWNINKNCNVNNMFIECPIKDKYKPKFK